MGGKYGFYEYLGNIGGKVWKIFDKACKEF